MSGLGFRIYSPPKPKLTASFHNPYLPVLPLHTHLSRSSSPVKPLHDTVFHFTVQLILHYWGSITSLNPIYTLCLYTCMYPYIPLHNPHIRSQSVNFSFMTEERGSRAPGAFLKQHLPTVEGCIDLGYKLLGFGLGFRV